MIVVPCSVLVDSITSNSDFSQSVVHFILEFPFFLEYSSIFSPNLASANRPIPFEPAKTLSVLGSK